MNGIIPYASRTGTRRQLAAFRRYDWRLLVSAAHCLRSEGLPYALDNGAWTYYQKGRPFDERRFVVALRKMGGGADWTTLPDIVGGGHPSLELSLRWMRQVLDECPRALLAVQNGMTPDDVRPFLGERVGIFVGGFTEWKLETLPVWAQLAREVGCWCHVARVNTGRRISLCIANGATSFDGTSGTRYAKNVPKLDKHRRQLSLCA